jgi:protein-tyrosine phosphatase
MIDLHCHLLPGIDDGPQTLAEALDLARAAVADGITHSVLTPHVHLGRYENQRHNLEPALNEFSDQLRRADIPLKVSLGCEANLNSELIELMANDQVPFLGQVNGYRIMLLEFPPQMIPVGSIRLVNMMLTQKIRPLISHPERNKAIMANTEKVRPFTEAGCWLQLTAGSLAGRFGNPAQLTAFKLIDEGWDCVAATDAHNLEHRPPLLSEGREALRKRYGDAVAQAMVQDKPARIIGLKAVQT